MNEVFWDVRDVTFFEEKCGCEGFVLGRIFELKMLCKVHNDLGEGVFWVV